MSCGESWRIVSVATDQCQVHGPVHGQVHGKGRGLDHCDVSVATNSRLGLMLNDPRVVGVLAEAACAIHEPRYGPSLPWWRITNAGTHLWRYTGRIDLIPEHVLLVRVRVDVDVGVEYV